jgi:predicted nuclease of predicted toxin-antitoxin system
LQSALQQDRILLTSDKDFGELAFVRQLPHGVIVRLVDLNVDQQVAAIADLLRDHSVELTGATIVTVGRGRVRFRRTS